MWVSRKVLKIDVKDRYNSNVYFNLGEFHTVDCCNLTSSGLTELADVYKRQDKNTT